MQFASTSSPFSVSSLASNASNKISEGSTAGDYVARSRRCERNIAPLTREQAQQRIECTYDPVTLEQRCSPTNALYHRRPTTVLLKGLNNTNKEEALWKHLAALNGPAILDELTDTKKMVDKIISMDYRLKLDTCLRRDGKRC